MPIDRDAIENAIQQLLQNNDKHQWQLAKMEKLVIDSIIQKITYREAATKYQYTESSFQNAASKLFKKLSSILGQPINRHNLLDVLADLATPSQGSKQVTVTTFDQIQANLWVNTSREKAQLVCISYQSSQLLNIKEYLLNYSPYFQATCCLDISANSVQGFLQSIGNALLVRFHDSCTPLESINLVLQKRPTLLVIRFDRGVNDQSLLAKYAEIITNITLAPHRSCLLVINQGPPEKSFVHHVQGMIDRLTVQEQIARPRTMVINHDALMVSEVLKIYLSS
jgi:hypothetical protein